VEPKITIEFIYKPCYHGFAVHTLKRTSSAAFDARERTTAAVSNHKLTR
jgi:hypothetical protein